MATSTVFVDVSAEKSYYAIMLSPKQSRAARGWLDWSQDDLATRARVSLSTVRDFEKGRRIPIRNNLDALESALREAGVVLTFREDDPKGIEVISID